MEINKKRIWGVDPATGVMSHVKLPVEEMDSGLQGLVKRGRVPTGFTTAIREPIVRCRTAPTPVLTETTEKAALPPEYPWQPRIPEWAIKVEISSQIRLWYPTSNAVIRIGHGRPLILIHKNVKNRSHLEKFYCATIKDVETEEEFTVSWDEITPWNA